MNPDVKPGTDTVKCKVSAVKSTNDDSSDNDKPLFPDSSDKDTGGSSNRDNPALKRQKK